MSRHPAATREDHDDFCVAEKWQLIRGASGQPVRHHRTYELTLWDGHILRTRISRPVDKSTYSAGMWTHILRTQLAVDPEAFWACVRDKKLPDRGAPETVTQREPLPLYLVRALSELGVDESESLTLTAAEAAQLLSEKMAERYGHQRSS
ncbi:cytotoxic translational repressor of toxin-antitoxin stability system [Cryobacterium algoritolerans]|uniref:Cytotoxic translational repressor of toxin-antitoxin stability system n=1 Tax=Cryobacterium algoritolerans TaxID=1259184 RepID=A0A4R8WUA3_9MICO|nr:cytotoxic translational repressor of toxin-antitoxin stability system [Cryobacterium algoritolerans]TFC15287.1 cytotoxic translational repressor of toxin-antitoxin stability system [Cryobacterium algoritolerans]